MSETQQRLFAEFPPITTAEWEAAIQRDLKGADYAKKLLWRTDEGITVKPYYRSEDCKGLDHLDTAPGEFPYTRGTKASAGWRIREEILETDPVAANAAARAALTKGAEEVSFILTPNSDLPTLVKGLEGVPVHFRATGEGVAILKGLADFLRNKPLAGSLDCPLESDIQAAASTARQILRSAPDFRPLAVRCYEFAERGATTVQELGFGLARAVDMVAALTSAGWTAAEAGRALFFSFATGSNYFFELAKLRAARPCWAQIMTAIGVEDPAAQKMVAHCRTARWNKTIYDPYVNLLRATTEAMSAALGGADSITVGAFDEVFRAPGDFSRRLARNTQIILKKEAYMDRVADPAGGSYYVEVLTGSIAREAWRLFQEVETRGGFQNAREWALAEVDKARAAKEAAIATRRRSIVGVNQYPNLHERMLGEIQIEPPPGAPKRGAEVFEAIRLRTERHAASGGKTPKFLLAEMGDLKMRKARSSFVANFLGCAGFEVVTQFFDDVEAAAKGARECTADAVVLCSSDEEYPSLAAPLIQRLGGVPVIVAGYPKDAVNQLQADGVADFIHIRSNAAETLSAWQKRLGVKG